MTPRFPCLAATPALVLLSGMVGAQQAHPRPAATLVRDVVLDRAGADDSRHVSLLLRDGRIVEWLDPDAEAPPGVRVVEGEGRLALPAFLDAYTRKGVTTPEPVKDQDAPKDERADVRVDMRLANRKGLQPAFRAVEALVVEEQQGKAWRESGFGAALVSPSGQLLSGASVLATTREAAARDVVVEPVVFMHAAFQASGKGYPSTLMGYIAQLRQFFLDAQRHLDLTARYEAGNPVLRPAWDADLEAGLALLRKERALLCEAETHRDIERWIKLADEFGLELAIAGGRDAWRVAGTLVERDIPVVLTLDWGDEVDDPTPEKKEEEEPEEAEGEKAEGEEAESEGEEEEGEEAEEEEETDEEEADWEYLEPLLVREERRRLWEEKRDCAIRLREAGVSIAFGSSSDKPDALLKRVRTLVDEGLPADAALAAMTTEAASLLGVGKRLGRLEPGFDATFTLWTEDPLTEKKAQTAWIFIDGYGTEFEVEEPSEGPADGVDVTGTWNVTTKLDGEEQTATLILEMDEDGTVNGKLQRINPMDGSEIEAEVSGQVSGKEATLEATFSVGDFDIDVTLRGDVDGDAMKGDSTMRMPWAEEAMTGSFAAEREPGQGTHEEAR